MVRRSVLEIYFDILAVVSEGTDKPTRIMYETNLSWAPLRKMLDSLINGGFISVETQGNSRRYHITEKGERALAYHLKSLTSLEGLVKVRQTLSG